MRFIDEIPKGVTERIELRRSCGINIVWGKVPVFAYQLYEVVYSNGESAVVRGRNLQTLVGSDCLNGTKKQRLEVLRAVRGDLETPMQAARILLTSIENACWELDKPRTKTRAPRPVRTGTSALRKRRSATKPEGRK